MTLGLGPFLALVAGVVTGAAATGDVATDMATGNPGDEVGDEVATHQWRAGEEACKRLLA